MDNDKYYTLEEVADLLKVTYMTTYRWVRSRKLKAVKASKQYRVRSIELDNFLQSSTNA